MPPVPPTAQAPVEVEGPVQKFFKAWKEWTDHYSVDWRPSPEDYVTVRRLLKKHDFDVLKRLAREFWLTESSPLIDAGYRHHMRLFAAKLKELT